MRVRTRDAESLWNCKRKKKLFCVSSHCVAKTELQSLEKVVAVITIIQLTHALSISPSCYSPCLWRQRQQFKSLFWTSLRLLSTCHWLLFPWLSDSWCHTPAIAYLPAVWLFFPIHHWLKCALPVPVSHDVFGQENPSVICYPIARYFAIPFSWSRSKTSDC